jgi:hypothetical protein
MAAKQAQRLAFSLLRYYLQMIFLVWKTPTTLFESLKFLLKPIFDMSLTSRRYPRTFHRFPSRADIDPPVWTNQRHQDHSALAPGHWFVAFYKGLKQAAPGPDWLGPHIYDTDGELIWAGGTSFKNWNTFDFRVTNVGTEQMLTLLSNHRGPAQAYMLDHQ